MNIKWVLRAGMLLVVGISTVDAITIADLGRDGSLVAGDKRFANFQIISTDVTPEQVNVVTIGNGSANDLFGVAFQGNWTAVNGQMLEFSLRYTVETTDGSHLVSDIHQYFEHLVDGTAGVISVVESAWSQGFEIGSPVAHSSVGFSLGTLDQSDPDAEGIEGDVLNLNPPLQKLWITKNIKIGAADDGTVSLTLVEQRFSQVSTPVPDGGFTLILLGAVLTGFGVMRRFA